MSCLALPDPTDLVMSMVDNYGDDFAKPHTLAYKALTFSDHGEPYMNIFKYMKNIE